MSLTKMRARITKIQSADPDSHQKAKTASVLLSIVGAAMRGLDMLLIFVFGDPHWKSRTRIDWRKVMFFRKPLTTAERRRLRRQGDQVLRAEYGDDVDERVKREVTEGERSSKPGA